MVADFDQIARFKPRVFDLFAVDEQHTTGVRTYGKVFALDEDLGMFELQTFVRNVDRLVGRTPNRQRFTFEDCV